MLIFFALALSGCTLGRGLGGIPTPPGSHTIVPSREPATPAPTNTLEPTPEPSTLVICTASDPDTLYRYGGSSQAQMAVFEALYDGPIDLRNFKYEPVILEKLPNIQAGDAALEPVPVKEGDPVVNDAGALVRLAPGEKVRPFGCNDPSCAVAWDGGDLEMAQLSATFTLLDGLQWSDGTPLTARDSVFSYEVAKDCQTESGPCGGAGFVEFRQGTVDRTATYTAEDERTVRWTGVPGFLDPDYQANFFAPLPAHQLEGISHQDLFTTPEASRAPLGWGPYVLTRWEPGKFILMQDNPNYFRKNEGLPEFDQLIFRFVGLEKNAVMAALQSGTCDVMDTELGDILAGEEIQSIIDMDASGKIAAHFTTGTVWEHADFAIQRRDYDDGYQLGTDPPALFNDVRTRKAIALCMDRQQVVNRVLFGKSAVPDSYIPAEHPLFDPNVTKYPFDPQAGMALLDETGWIDADGIPETPRTASGVPEVPDGTSLSFEYLTTPGGQQEQAAEILADSLAQCGVDLQLQLVPGESLYAAGPDGALFGRNFDMAQFAWLTGVQPPCWLFTSDQTPGPPQGQWIPFGTLETRTFPLGWGGQNETGYSNPDFDQACQAALESLPDEAGTLENHQKAQEIFTDELPVIPLYWRVNLAVTRPDLCGFEFGSGTASTFWNLERFNYGKDCS